MKILFVIDTFHRGRHVLLEIPFSNLRKETGHSTSNWYPSKFELSKYFIFSSLL